MLSKINQRNKKGQAELTRREELSSANASPEPTNSHNTQYIMTSNGNHCVRAGRSHYNSYIGEYEVIYRGEERIVRLAYNAAPTCGHESAARGPNEPQSDLRLIRLSFRTR